MPEKKLQARLKELGYRYHNRAEYIASNRKYAKELKKRKSEIIISVDGGVDLKNAPALIEAGATRLVSGSAILKSDNIKKTIEQFKELLGS